MKNEIVDHIIEVIIMFFLCYNYIAIKLQYKIIFVRVKIDII